MTHDPTRDCEHGRLKGKCDVCDLQAEVLEQCRINGMSAEREDALRAELTQLKASIALDWMAKNAREIGLDYEPPKQDVPETNFGNMAHPDYAWPTIEQRAVIQQMVDALDHADDLLCDTLVMNGAAAGRWLLEQPAGQEPVQDSTCNETLRVQGKAYPRTCKKCGLGPCVGKPKSVTTPPTPQPVPVKTYHDGKPWPVAPMPWAGLTDEMVVRAARELCKIHAGECQVDEQDTWNLYAHQFKRDARCALEAAHDGKPWPVAPKPWVGLSEDEINKLRHLVDWTAEWSYGRFAYELERLLRERNT